MPNELTWLFVCAVVKEGGSETRQEFGRPITQRKQTAAADYVESYSPGTKVTNVTFSRHLTGRSLKRRYDFIVTPLWQRLTLFDILTCRGFVTGTTAWVFTVALASLTKSPAHVTGVKGVKFRAALDVMPVCVPRSTYETLPPSCELFWAPHIAVPVARYLSHSDAVHRTCNRCMGDAEHISFNCIAAYLVVCKVTTSR